MRAAGATLAALFRRRLTFEVLESTVRKTLGASWMFRWIILAALCFGAVFDGLGAVRGIEGFFLDRLGLVPRETLTWRWIQPTRSCSHSVGQCSGLADGRSRGRVAGPRLAAAGPGHVE